MNRRERFAVGTGALLAAAPAYAATARPPDGKRERLISAADFGAVGDGQADDTAALQAALEALFSGAAKGDGSSVLLIPPGAYRITRTLAIKLTKQGKRQPTRQTVIRSEE